MKRIMPGNVEMANLGFFPSFIGESLKLSYTDITNPFILSCTNPSLTRRLGTHTKCRFVTYRLHILAKKDGRSKKEKFEEDLLQTIKNGKFEEIKKKITPKAIKSCKSDALLMGMKVRIVAQL